MNRRKAVLGVISLVGLGGISFGGYKFFQWNKNPALDVLQKKGMLINELAQIILPVTDTPGAKNVDIGEVVISLIQNCFDKRDLNTFIDGLENLEEFCKSEYNNTFTDCSEKEKENVLTYFSQVNQRPKGLVGRVKTKLIGTSFFRLLRDYIVVAFYTSEIGASQALRYDYVPGSYLGCIQVSEPIKGWAVE